MIYTLAGIGVVFGFVFCITKGIHFSKEDKDEKKGEEKPAGKNGKGAPRSHG
ncbi:hypothetical protein [Cohnella fermenti]|uniref:hypothetical protein n=1 Tax=Cohnella fermenti TaxID=2565925 RepID=UPI001454DF82|nr:hypothetical protein [Cohnella fermenti]